MYSLQPTAAFSTLLCSVLLLSSKHTQKTNKQTETKHKDHQKILSVISPLTSLQSTEMHKI